MAKPLDTPFGDRSEPEAVLPSEPLGIKNPLLPARALGQTEPNLQFMLPLGARPLASLDPSIFFPEGGSEYADIGQSFAELPFFDNPSSTSPRDSQGERKPIGLTQASSVSDTPIQRQATSLDASIPLQAKTVSSQEQAEVQRIEGSEPTVLPGSTVEPQSLPDEPIANELETSEISSTPDLEPSIQRSPEILPYPSETTSPNPPPTQPSVAEFPAAAPTASEQTISERIQPLGDGSDTEMPISRDTGNFEEISVSPSLPLSASTDVPQLLDIPATTSDSPTPDQSGSTPPLGLSSTTDATVQTQLVPQSPSEAAPSPPQAPSAGTTIVTNEPAAEPSLAPSPIGESRLLSTESPQEAQIPQADADSSVSELSTAATVQRQAIPEQPQTVERPVVDAIQAQPSPPQEAEGSTLRQVTHLSESPTHQYPSQQSIQDSTESEDSGVSVSSLLSSTDKPTPLELVENVPIASAELTTSTEQETIQPRFESASPQLETPASSLFDLPIEAATASGEPVENVPTPSAELTTSTGQETIQLRFESALPQAETTASSLLATPATDDRVGEERSQSPSELPLPTPTQASNAVPSSTPTPDSPLSTLEVATPAPAQNPSPAASIPTAEAEAIVQPQLESVSESTSTTPASTSDSGSIVSKLEAEERQSPRIEAPAQETSIAESSRHLGEVSIQPQLESTPIAVDRIEPTQKLPSRDAESGAVTAESQQFDSSGLTIESESAVFTQPVSSDSTQETLRASRETTSSTDEARATETAIVQPDSESIASQDQVIESSTLDQPATNPQSIIQAKELELTASPDVQEVSPLVPVDSQPETLPAPSEAAAIQARREPNFVEDSAKTWEAVSDQQATAPSPSQPLSEQVGEPTATTDLQAAPETSLELQPELKPSALLDGTAETPVHRQIQTEAIAPETSLELQPELKPSALVEATAQTTLQGQTQAEAIAAESNSQPQPELEPSALLEATAETTIQRQTQAEAIAAESNSSPHPNPAISSIPEESQTTAPFTLPTDRFASTEPNFIQPFREPTATRLDELPKLPTVLQDLTILDPLVSTPAIQTASLADTAPPAEPVPATDERREPHPPVLTSSSLPSQSVSQPTPTLSSREAVASVPSEWSSIAELLNGTSFSTSSTSPQDSSSFPDLQPFREPETVIQAQFESATRQTQSDILPTIQADEERTNVTEVKANTGEGENSSPEQLEKLAREIYGLVRQRLRIEQERSGNSYSGRLPW